MTSARENEPTRKRTNQRRKYLMETLVRHTLLLSAVAGRQGSSLYTVLTRTRNGESSFCSLQFANSRYGGACSEIERKLYRIHQRRSQGLMFIIFACYPWETNWEGRFTSRKNRICCSDLLCAFWASQTVYTLRNQSNAHLLCVSSSVQNHKHELFADIHANAETTK